MKYLPKLTALILSLAILVMAIPFSVYADEPDYGDLPIKPNIVVQADDWIVMTFSDKVEDKVATGRLIEAFLAEKLAEMIAAEDYSAPAKKGEFGILSGTNNMQDEEDTDFGDSYVHSYFGTYATWQSSPADFWGNATAYWFGNVPAYNCDVIQIEMTVRPEVYYGYIQTVPGGWQNYYYFATSGLIKTFNNWYLIAAWEGLEASYPFRVYVDQNDTHAFEFGEDDPPAQYLHASMQYGDN